MTCYVKCFFYGMREEEVNIGIIQVVWMDVWRSGQVAGDRHARALFPRVTPRTPGRRPSDGSAHLPVLLITTSSLPASYSMWHHHHQPLLTPKRQHGHSSHLGIRQSDHLSTSIPQLSYCTPFTELRRARRPLHRRRPIPSRARVSKVHRVHSTPPRVVSPTTRLAPDSPLDNGAK